MIRSNPDLKNILSMNSPNGSCNGNGHHPLQQKTPVMDPYGTQQHAHVNCKTPQQQHNSSAAFKNDLTTLSNNLSLNLSIHTAEEFGIEMLEWLNNEGNAHFNTNGDQVKLPNNATLV
jgi:hypothetical protein